MEIAADIHERFQLWKQSHRLYAHDLHKIQTIEGSIAPFDFNGPQTAVDEIIDDIRAAGRLVRVIILKLRRAGISSQFASRDYWLTNMNPHTHALMVTHEPEATDTVFGMHKRFHAHTPTRLQPKVLYDNRKVLEFNTKDRKSGLDSSVRVGTAGKENFGSSQLVHYAHFSEFSKWPSHCITQLMTSLMPCIPKTPESEIIIESTANGVGNMFYAMYWAARYRYSMYLDENGELAWKMEINNKARAGNIWSTIFIPWFVFEKNQMPVKDWMAQTGATAFNVTDEEKVIIETYLKHIPLAEAHRKIAWRRLSIANDFDGDVQRFNQENPATPELAFISTGECAFNTEQLVQLIDAAPAPIARYEVDPETGTFTADPNGRLLVWEEPKAGESYAIPADVAQGIVVDEGESDTEQRKHDFSTFSVKKQLSRVECAKWLGKIDPDLFGQLMVWVGRRYNESWLIPESNNHGHTAIAAILRMKYKKLFVEHSVEPPNKRRKAYGFNTQGGRDGGVRAEAVNALVALMRTGRHGIRSVETFEEMLSFKKNARGIFKAEKKRHDDSVTMEAVGAFCIPLLPLPAAARVLQAAQLLAMTRQPQAAPAAATQATEGWT